MADASSDFSSPDAKLIALEEQYARDLRTISKEYRSFALTVTLLATVFVVFVLVAVLTTGNFTLGPGLVSLLLVLPVLSGLLLYLGYLFGIRRRLISLS